LFHTRSARIEESAVRVIDHFIAGEAPAGERRSGDVFDPNNGGVQAQVRLGTAADLDQAVDAAFAAQPAWAAANPQRRARVLFRFRELVEAEMDGLAHLLASEHGKVVSDARGDIQRGLDVIEFACGIPHALKGEYTAGAGPGIDVYGMRQPIGIGAGITPFNFPAMIPMWMFGPAIACGNAFILKPSERDPSVPVRLAELMREAGLPEGILQVLHGDKEMVDAILDHPAIGAVSFVGSSDIAHYVYSRGVAAGKRVQAMGGAKNHGVVMPDADLDQAVADICGAAFGSAGERCMALPVVVPVGEKTANALREKLIPAIRGLRVGVSTDAEAHYGPVVSAAHKARIESYIQMCQDEGGELVIDGRGFTLQGHEEGFFVGPTFFDHVKPTFRSYKEEIFGPVLQMVRADSFEEALRLPSDHEYGNGVAIFTRNGHAAREFAARVNVGMVGINVPIPVPVAYHTFGGWKRSGFGDIDQHGPEGVRFWTKNKKITQRWPDGSATGENAFVIPTMG
jgi:malonate-semialdehyde dehydrogenase (acetylating)/methylmalonate-semialdehyde dehydrogenase